jgi:uncharacterized membrane protein YwaF
MSMINAIVLKYFSIQHLLNVLYIPAIVVAFYYIFRNKSEKTKTWALLGLSIFNIIIFTINKFVLFRVFDDLEVLNELPLHLCNMNLILIPVALLTKNKLLMGYTYYVATIAAMAAILFFDSRYVGVNVMTYSIFVYFFYHAVLVATPILLVMFGLYTPEKSQIINVIILLLCMATVMHGFNLFMRSTGLCTISNYFYTMGMEGNPVLELLMKLVPIPLVYYFPMIPALNGYAYLITIPFLNKNYDYEYAVIG